MIEYHRPATAGRWHVVAAEKTDCIVHLVQVSRHLLQFADDGSFGRGYFGHFSLIPTESAPSRNSLHRLFFRR